MKATFSKVVEYQIKATCKTPLRTASSTGEVDEILLTKQKYPFIQGSSLVGSMRTWAKVHGNVETVNALFGNNEAEGSLIVSDGLFQEKTKVLSRPRLRISKETGSVADGAKFDVSHVEAGSIFEFSITCLGDELLDDKIVLVEQILAAFEHEEICLGAQKSNGFGKISLEVKKLSYDMFDDKEREAWMKGEKKYQPFTISKISQSSFVQFIIYGKTKGLLVKDSVTKTKRSFDQTLNRDTTRNYEASITEGGKVIIPGSSLKGAMRNQIGSIAEVMGLDKSYVLTAFGSECDVEEEKLAGTIRFQDVTFQTDINKQQISRIKINRFTAGVMDKKLFTEEVVSGEVVMKIAIPKEQEVMCGLLIYALKDLADGLYSLGSGSSIGRGKIEIEKIEVRLGDGQTESLSFQVNDLASLESKESIYKWLQKVQEVAI